MVIFAGVLPSAYINGEQIAFRTVHKQKGIPPPTNTKTKQKLPLLPQNINENINEKINLNTATEQEIAAIPNIGAMLAKRAIELREQNGDFLSVRDFSHRLGLMPHIAVQTESFAFAECSEYGEVGALSAPQDTKTKVGRVIDV
jgi:hypothetical protein